MSTLKFNYFEFNIEFILNMVYDTIRKEVEQMTDEEQKRIFANNLNRYISLNQKQQVDVAKDLGINPTTFNMWCKGNSMPNVGKIQKLADYFGIGKSDLTDLKESREPDKEYADTTLKIALYDERFKKIIIEYSKLPSAKRDLPCDFFETFIF